MEQYDWGNALDDLKATENLKSDASLAKTLGVSRAFLSAIRQGKKNIPTDICKEILGRLGHADFFEEYPESPIKTSIHARIPLLAQTKEALNRAQGHCELCKMPAPFWLPNGHPYLEAHHITSKHEKGNMQHDQVVMLCPNCHKKIHVLKSAIDINKLTET